MLIICKHIKKLSTEKYIFNIISVFLIICSLNGCTTKCPEFNEDILNWLPYKLNDKIVLCNDNSFDTLTVQHSEVNHTNSYPSHTQCMCSSSFSVELLFDSVYFTMNFDDEWHVEKSSIEVNAVYLFVDEQLDSLEVSNKVYQNVIIFKTNIQHPSYKFHEIYISKYIGIIYISGPNESWTIIDDSQRQIGKEDISYISSDCK